MEKFLRFFVLVVCSTQLINAGYLEFEADGTPYKWNVTNDIQIAVDPGDVSGSVTNAQGDAVLAAVIGYYNGVTGTDLNISIVGDASTDITSSNYTSFINFSSSIQQQASSSSCLIGQDVAGADLVVFYDQNGSFFSSVGLGSGVLGIASPTLYNGSGDITCAYLMINGAAVDNTDELEYIMAHELGHALNLVHSQINGDIIDSEPQKTPLMYPLIPTDPAAALAVPLKLDDLFSYSYLYAPDEIAGGGSIAGTVSNRFNEGVLGVNVICRDPDTVENSVSWISGAELNDDGAYACGLLPNGDYEVEISPIQTAINIWDENPPFIPTEYYSGADESFDPDVDELSSNTQVSVTGSAVGNIDFVLNEDGRLSNGVSVSSSVDAGTSIGESIIPQIKDLEYFIFVPSNADSVTFSLEAENSSDDIDLLVRCGSPFSLATGTVGPLYDQSDPVNDQTDAAGVTTSGSENIELNSSSSPSIQECEYHLMVVNYTAQDIDFDLSATFTGNAPRVVLDFDARDVLQDNGETLVAELTALADGDRFLIDAIKFTDQGKEGARAVASAKLYRDDNENGQVDDTDTLIGQTASVNNDEFTISDLDLYLLDGEDVQYLVTYDLNVQAGYSYWYLLLLLGLALGTFVIRPRSSMKLCIILVMLAGVSCSSSSTSDYEVSILNKSDITGSALGFGSDFRLSSDAVQSVEDFFSN